MWNYYQQSADRATVALACCVADRQKQLKVATVTRAERESAHHAKV